MPGYPGGRVKVGNWVNRQFQLDGLGDSLLLLAAADRADRLDLDHWKAAEIAVNGIATRWQQPDAGIWELDNNWWTHSRLACVAGLRGIAARAAGPQAGQWTALADAIAAEVARTSVHPTGRWQRAPDDPRVDAALLFSAIREEYQPTTRAPSPPGRRSKRNCARTGTSTVTVTTTAPSKKPKGPSPYAGSPCPSLT